MKVKFFGKAQAYKPELHGIGSGISFGFGLVDAWTLAEVKYFSSGKIIPVYFYNYI